MTIKDENNETPLCINRGMQEMVKAKSTYLLQEKLGAQDTSEESSNMNKSEHSVELFDLFIQNKQ